MIKKKEDKMKKEILPNVCESTQCKSCDKNCIWKPQSYTNADKIRAMTDEELAEWGATLPCCPPGPDLNELCFPQNQCENFSLAKQCWLDWLKQEG